MANQFKSFDLACDWAIRDLVNYGTKVDTGTWQGVPTQGRPDLVTREIVNLAFQVPMERGSWHDDDHIEWEAEMAFETQCNMEWADEHFAERVGGVPLNPDPSYQRWPWWSGGQQSALSMEGTVFSHTYSERFWPKQANYGVQRFEPGKHFRDDHQGIRFQYGDYNDLLTLLQENPYTRQAYLPIFFPEDTGAVHGGRIPCTLGYHFLLRNNQLHCWYPIRSCDAVRHFRDDLYLAIRLVGHTIDVLLDRELRSDRDQVWNKVYPGMMFFQAYSFHAHMGDWHRLEAS